MRAVRCLSSSSLPGWIVGTRAGYITFSCGVASNQMAMSGVSGLAIAIAIAWFTSMPVTATPWFGRYG
jgi:hypothetical protein